MIELTGGIAGIPWMAEQLGLSERQVRRLAAQRLLPGVYQSQKHGRYKVRKVEFLHHIEARKIKGR